jgi:hypothetical protein
MGMLAQDVQDRFTNTETQLAEIVQNIALVESFPAIFPETNDSPRIQRAIDSLGAGNGIVQFASKPYNIGGGANNGIAISNKSNLQIIGYGAVLNITLLGSPATQGVKLMGTLTNVIIEGLTIMGSGNVADNHVGIYTPMGNLIGNNIKILNNRIFNTIAGIDVNAEQIGGSLNDVLIQGNYCENIVGTDPGYGYGIHTSDQVGAMSNVKIIGNTIVKAQRHSIYYSNGGGGLIANNTIRDHRLVGAGQGAGGAQKPAIDLGQCQFVDVIGNVIENFWDGGIDIWGCKHVTVTGNIFRQPKNNCSIYIGSSNPTPGGDNTNAENIVVANNIIYQDGTNIGSTHGISLLSGLRIKIIGNSMYLTNSANLVSGVHIWGSGESAGTAIYNDDIEISNNTIFGSNITGGFTYGFDLENNACISNMGILFKDNIVKVPNATFDIYVALSNPNIELLGQQTDGISFSGANFFKQSVIGNLGVAKGASGTYTTADSKTVTVTNGIITKIQ